MRGRYRCPECTNSGCANACVKDNKRPDMWYTQCTDHLVYWASGKFGQWGINYKMTPVWRYYDEPPFVPGCC